MKPKSVLLAGVLVLLVASLSLAGIGTGRKSSESKPLGALRENPYDSNSLSNPYGAGSPYRSDGLMNPYSRYGSPYSNQSWRNPYATEAPRLYEGGKYRGRFSTNPYNRDSISNPYGRYGSPYSRDSIRNPYGAGSPYSKSPIYIWPGK